MAARRTWLDPRLVIGVVLVLASVVGVWLVVQQSSRSEAAWAATRTLLPGETIGAGDVQPVALRLPQSHDRYLDGAADPVGLVVAVGVAVGVTVGVAVGLVVTVGAAVAVGVALGLGGGGGGGTRFVGSFCRARRATIGRSRVSVVPFHWKRSTRLPSSGTSGRAVESWPLVLSVQYR